MARGFRGQARSGGYGGGRDQRGASVLIPDRAVDISALTALSWSILNLGPYVFNAWPGTASAGGSGSEVLSNIASGSGNAMSVGLTLNGIETAAGNGGVSSRFLQSTNNASSYVTVSARSMFVLFNATVLPADVANNLMYQVEDLITDRSGFQSCGVSTSGFRAGQTSGGWVATPYSAYTVNNWALGQVRFGSTTLESRLNGGAWGTVSIGNLGNVASRLEFGRPSGGGSGTYLNGRIAAVGVANSRFSDANFESVRTTLNSYYKLSL